MYEDLNILARDALAVTTAKGFHETENSLRIAVEGDAALTEEVALLQTARRLALIQSEVSEALEASRKGRHADMNGWNGSPKTKEDFEKYVKDSFEDELADALIRIAELAGTEGIDLAAHVEAKMAYNVQRPYKFGKKY